MPEGKQHIDTEKVIQHWYAMSEKDFATMHELFDIKEYAWALFLGHLTLEKLLKAIYVKKPKMHAPFTHSLIKLAMDNSLELNDEYLDWLDKITTFNISTRYDDYINGFYLLCTEDYASEWITKIKIIRSWLNKIL